MPEILKKLWVKITGVAMVITTLAVFGIDFDEIKPITEATAEEKHAEVYIEISQLRTVVFDDKCLLWQLELSEQLEKAEQYPPGQMPDWLRKRIIALQALIAKYNCP